jgi:hypothetical protein
MKKKLLSIAVIMTLSACGSDERPAQPYQQVQQAAPIQQAAPYQQAPVVVQQSGSSNDGMLTGGLLGAAAGYMIGKSSTPSVSANVVERHTTIVNHYEAPAKPAAPVVAAAAPVAPVTAKPVAPAPVAKPSYAPSYVVTPKAAPAPTPKPSYSPSYSAPSRSSAPSYSSSYSSSSRSSGGRK